MKTGLLVGAFSLLAAVAAVGWTRKLPSPQGVDTMSQQFSTQPATYAVQPQSNFVANSGDASPSFVSRGTRLYTSSDGSYAVRRVSANREYANRYYPNRTYVRPRSTKKSIAIVAGGSGVGAAIGALAGGGRGAAIGALAGGGAGFIYDRLTHRRPPQF
jgi:hypothetical protein